MLQVSLLDSGLFKDMTTIVGCIPQFLRRLVSSRHTAFVASPGHSSLPARKIATVDMFLLVFSDWFAALALEFVGK